MRTWGVPVLAVALVLYACASGEPVESTVITTPTTTSMIALSSSTTTTFVTTVPSPVTTTTGVVTTIAPVVSGPFIVAHYVVGPPPFTFILEVVSVAGTGEIDPLVLDGLGRLESDGAGGVIFSRFDDPGVWHWPSGASDPHLVGDIDGPWSVGFIDDEPVLLIVSDDWKESGFGWCEGEPCFGDDGYQMGSGDRIVTLMRIADGQVTEVHRERFVIGFSGAPNELTHSVVAGGSSIGFVRNTTPDYSNPIECQQFEFRTTSDELVSYPANPYDDAVCPSVWIELHGIDRRGSFIVYEEPSNNGDLALVASELVDDAEPLRITTWDRPEDPVSAHSVDFDPSGIVALLWTNLDTGDSYTEVIDIVNGTSTTLAWPPVDPAQGFPMVTFLPKVVDIDLARLIDP
jgi:hypothetical protein